MTDVLAPNTAVDTAIDVEEHRDVAYHPTIGRDKARELDLYVPRQPAGASIASKPPLIVFVHGGAWRA
jgi:acetyl esterase/lipase